MYRLGAALGSIFVTGIVGAGVGVGWFLKNILESENADK